MTPSGSLPKKRFCVGVPGWSRVLDASVQSKSRSSVHYARGSIGAMTQLHYNTGLLHSLHNVTVHPFFIFVTVRPSAGQRGKVRQSLAARDPHLLSGVWQRDGMLFYGNLFYYAFFPIFFLASWFMSRTATGSAGAEPHRGGLEVTRRTNASRISYQNPFRLAWLKLQWQTHSWRASSWKR